MAFDRTCKKTVPEEKQKYFLNQKVSPKKYFVMTVDVDGWSTLLNFYSSNYNSSKADTEVDIRLGVQKLINLFKKHNVVATFFVTGNIAYKYPNTVRIISREGHEVACHGMMHEKNECLLQIDKQRHRIRKATQIIEERTGKKPLGFRAPCLRANKYTFKVLRENGYMYDSSMISTFIPRYYGQLNFHFRPYWLNLDVENVNQRILEIPISVNPLVPLPLSAAWMRNLGQLWVKFGILANFLLGDPLVFYIHPRDVLSLPKVEGVPWHVYRNTGINSIKMLNEILTYAKSIGAVFVRAIDLAFMISQQSEVRI